MNTGPHKVTRLPQHLEDDTISDFKKKKTKKPRASKWAVSTFNSILGVIFSNTLTETVSDQKQNTCLIPLTSNFKLYHPVVLSDPVLCVISEFNVEKYSNKSQPQLIKN
jgi:hypothetical protein